MENILTSINFFFCRLSNPPASPERSGEICRELHVHPSLPQLQVMLLGSVLQ